MKKKYKVFFISWFVFLFFIPTINANINSLYNDVENPQRFVVYYDGDLNKLLNSGDSYLKSFLEAYNLEIVNTFEIDDNNRGFTLIARENITAYNNLARELSMLDEVVMVEVIMKSPKKTET